MKVKSLMKKSLSVLLAGALSLTVFTACEDKDNGKDGKASSVKEMLLEVFETASNSNSFYGVFSGDANYASKTESVIEFGEGVTKALGTEVKPLSLASETKLKGSKAGTDIAFSYDGKNLVSLNGVYDNDSKSIYIKVPELSDAYISSSLEDYKALMDEFTVADGIVLNDLTNITASSAMKNLSDFKVTDYEKIFNDYIKVVTDALPEASNEEDFSGSISDVKYDYKLKTFTITADNAKKIIEDVFEKLKNDDKVKELAVGILGSYIEITEDNYASKIDELKDEVIKDLSSDFNEEINLIFDGKDIVGIKDKATFMCIDKKDAYVLSVESETLNYLFKATEDDGKIDFDLTTDIVATDEGAKNVSIALKAEDFEIVDKDNGLASGDVDVTVKAGDYNVKLEACDKAESKKINSAMKLTVNDVEYVEVTSKNEITNASDISIPSGTIYKVNQMEEYQASMKLEEFMTSIQTALGEDLIAAITSLTSSVTALGGGDDYDFEDDSDVLLDDVSVDEDGLDLGEYYNEDGSFNYDKLKEDLGEEDYEAFMSQIDLDDFEVDADEIKL